MKEPETQRPPCLLKGTVDPKWYDDERALTEYLWKHYQHLLTPLELRVGLYGVPIVSDIDDEKGRRIYQYCEKDHGHVEDADVIAAFPRDWFDWRIRAQRRIMLECPEKVFVNRCPKCSRIVRSPSAHLCPWCKHRWLDK